MPDASPAKWHLAHTSWFFETVILSQLPGYKPFDPRFAYLFNSYYEALGPRHPRPRRGLITRPSRWTRCWPIAPMSMRRWRRPSTREDLRDAIVLGLNHEQQHQELILTDIKHAFFSNPLLPAYREQMQASPRADTPLDWISHSRRHRR